MARDIPAPSGSAALDHPGRGVEPKAPLDRPAAAPSLRAPTRDDSWRVTAAAPAPAAPTGIAAAPDIHLEATVPKTGGSTLWAGMALAAAVVAAVLAGMAALNYGSAPAPAKAPTQQVEKAG